MSKVRLDIPKELFEPAAVMHAQGSDVFDKIEYGGDEIVFTSPVEWDVDITNIGDALLVSGKASADIRTACARCLEDADMALEGDIEGYYLLNESAIDELELDEDEYKMLPESHEMILDDFICAALLLDYPQIPLCRDDCKGLCPRCGANLNDGSCDCEADVEVGSNSPFAVLKEIKFD